MENENNNSENQNNTSDPSSTSSSIYLNRVNQLKDLINHLKQQITIEKDLWTQEIWEYNRLRQQIVNQLYNKYQMPMQKSCLIDVPLPYTKTNSISNFNYITKNNPKTNEQFLELKYQSMRQMAANAYKAKLLEVESLCQLEMNRVKENFAYLQPLRGIASSWHDSLENRCDDLIGLSKLRDMSSGDHHDPQQQQQEQKLQEYKNETNKTTSFLTPIK